MPEIRLENLITRYGAVELLHSIDLSMAENEVHGSCGSAWVWQAYNAADDCRVGNSVIGGDLSG